MSTLGRLVCPGISKRDIDRPSVLGIVPAMPTQYAPFRVQLPADTVRDIYLYAQDHPDMTLGEVVADALSRLWEDQRWCPRPGSRVRSRRPGRRPRQRFPRDLVVLIDDGAMASPVLS
jgi:hypothetical protein